MSIAVVVPTIREECALRWLDEWKDDLAGARVIFVEDNPEPSFALGGGIEHYSWRDFGELGEDERIIPRRTSACRSYGFLKALEGGAEIIWTLDDDCYPEPARRGRYLDLIAGAFTAPATPGDAAWWDTIPSAGVKPRGYPYGIRDRQWPVMIHHGLWSEVPDLDGITQLANMDLRLPPHDGTQAVPVGAFLPFCIMNVAFRAEAAPLMYMLLMGQDQDGQRWGFDRYDDLWAGLLAKKAADRLGWAVTSGAPSIRHSKASDPHRNAELEAAGMKVHEDFWPYLRDVKLTGATAGECYGEFASSVERYWGQSPRPGYWQHLAAAMRTWVRLCAERGAK